MKKEAPAKPKRMSIEDLAGIIQRTIASKEDFIELREEMATKQDLARLERKVDDGFLHVNERLDAVRRDIADLDDLRERVHTIENHMGLSRKR